MAGSLRFLVIDAYARDGREALRSAGGTEGGRLYERLLRRLQPEASIDLVYPADEGESLPQGAALDDYDGAAWSGSSLTIHREGDPRVLRQVELARALFAARVPGFGSCWAVQLCALAAGGTCGPNSNGREFGVARQITLSVDARWHQRPR